MKQDRNIEREARAALDACAFAVSVGAAEPGVSEELPVMGFNLDATRFAVVRVEPGAARGKPEL